MTALIRIKPGEVLPPGEGIVVVIGNRSLFGLDRVIMAAPAGLSIEELIDAAWAGQPRPPVAVWLYRQVGGPVGEMPVPGHLWARVRPKPGTVVAFKAVAEGQNARTIALIGVAVAALVISAGLAAPLIAGAAGAAGAGIAGGTMIGGLFGAGTIGAGLLGAAVAVGGMLAVNALFPVPQAQLAGAADNAELPGSVRKTLFSLAGGTNQIRRFGSLPVVLGTHRISPPLLALPFHELLGDDLYLRTAFCVGYGALALSDWRIGETALAAFQNYTHEIRNGYASDVPLTLIPSDVTQEDLNILLEFAQPNTRTTPPDTDSITVEITAPQGIYRLNAQTGAQEAQQVFFNGSYQPVGGGPIVTFFNAQYFLESDTRRDAFGVQVPRGQYNVIVQRANADTDDSRISDKIYWTTLRSLTFESPVDFDAPLAVTALRIRASGQLNGTISNFNCLASSRQKSFNGTAWVDDQISSNPADLFRHVLQGKPNKRPVADDQIDLTSLQEWWAYCNASGFTYNKVIEGAQSVYGMLAEIASAGRAVPVRPDGRWSVMWERFDEPIAQHFTPRNSWGFSGHKIFKRMPHGLRVRFINAENGYQTDELIVYDDGFDETNATIFEALEFPGITSAALAWKHGRYHIAQARLRPEQYSINCDFEHLRCNRNSRVRVMNEVAGWGQLAFRVKAVSGQDISVDETVTMEPGIDYVARFRLASGDTVIRDVVSNVGEQSAFTLDGVGTVPAEGDLGFFGEAGGFESVVLRVFSIEHQTDLSARLLLVDDAPDIADSDQGEIPPFETFISPPVDPFSLPPQNLQVIEIVDPSKTKVRVRLSWSAQRLANVTSFEAEARQTGGDWGKTQTVYVPQQFADFVDIILGGWSFRVRSLFEDGSWSAWSVLDEAQITGITLTTPLTAVGNLRATYRDRVMWVDWDEIDQRASVYEIRKGDTAEGALFVVQQAHPPFATFGNDTYWIAAVSTPLVGLNVYSPWQSITIDGAQLARNVVLEYDEAALGWPGTFTGTVAISGALIRTGGGGNVLAIPDFLAEPDILNFGGGGGGTYQIPSSQVIDLEHPVACAISIDLKAGGANISQNILTEPDFLGNPDIFDTAASRFVEVYAEIAVAVDDPPVTFSAWERWSSGVKVARAVKMRLQLQALTGDVFAYASDCIFTVDVPDRLDHYKYTSNTAGDTIVFQPDLAAAPAPFLGGPNGDTVPLIAYNLINGDANDHVAVTSITASSCFVRVYQGAGTGTGVARQINVIAQGY